jgi:hypothetical protein
MMMMMRKETAKDRMKRVESVEGMPRNFPAFLFSVKATIIFRNCDRIVNRL